MYVFLHQYVTIEQAGDNNNDNNNEKEYQSGELGESFDDLMNRLLDINDESTI